MPPKSQALCFIVNSQRTQAHLDLARGYYELAAKTVEEVLQGIVAQGPVYTEDEYRCVSMRKYA